MPTKPRRRQDRLTPTQARAIRRARRQRRRRFVRFGIFVAVSGIAALFILSLFAPSLPISIGSSGPDGPGQRFSSQGRTHIGLDEDHSPYNSVPATSGWHYSQPLAPVRWGIHEEFITDEYVIHNLEHGGVAIRYDCPEGCPTLVQQLTDMVTGLREDDAKVVLAPYPGMETPIALTAWTFLLQLNEFDETAIMDFIDAHHSSPNSPEPLAR